MENDNHSTVQQYVRHEVFPCEEFSSVPLATLLAVLDCLEQERGRVWHFSIIKIWEREGKTQEKRSKSMR